MQTNGTWRTRAARPLPGARPLQHLYAALLGLPLAVTLFCSSGPADALVDMKNAYSSDKQEKIRSLYTKETVEALKECEASDPEGCAAFIGGRLFDRDATWDVIEEKTQGETARVSVRYTRHSAENMRGYEYVFTLKNEGGAWRVDMEREVRASAELAVNHGGKAGKR